MERRLAAIPAADAVGYSRLVAADEEGTIARLKAALEELIEPGIARHGGRIVKTMGDGLSAEFPSVVDAVRSAVETRRAMAKRAAAAPDDRRIVLRVVRRAILGDYIRWSQSTAPTFDPLPALAEKSHLNKRVDKTTIGPRSCARRDSNPRPRSWHPHALSI